MRSLRKLKTGQKGKQMFNVSVLKELTEQQVNEILEIVIEASEIDGARPFLSMLNYIFEVVETDLLFM